MRNDTYWQEIEGHPAFAENGPNKDKCWEWLEKFQQVAGRNLNSRSLIILKALLDNMYDAGKMEAENAQKEI